MKHHLNVVLIVTLIWSSVVYSGRIEPIKEGDTATYDGFIIDKAQEKVFRKINEEKKLLERKTLTLEQLTEMHKTRANYYKDLNSSLESEWRKKEVKSFLSRTVYFLGGVLITGAISYATIKYNRR